MPERVSFYWKKIGKAYKKAHAYLNQHDHLVTFCAALIVFFTFVTKEALQERWKETASSIDTAQYMYSIQNDTRQLENNFESVRHKINDVRIQMANAGKERTREEDEVIKEDVAALRGGLDRSEVSLSTLNILGDKLPSKSESRKKLEEIKKSIKTLRRKLDHIESLIQPHADTPADLNHLQIGVVDSTTARKEEFALAAPYNQLAADRRDLTDAIIKDAETLKSRNECYATIARRCSWVLYSIGSLLGILGACPRFSI